MHVGLGDGNTSRTDLDQYFQQIGLTPPTPAEQLQLNLERQVAEQNVNTQAGGGVPTGTPVKTPSPWIPGVGNNTVLLVGAAMFGLVMLTKRS